MSNCKYCGNESYDRPFCPTCGKKYFGIELPITEQHEKIKIEKSNKNISQNNQLTQHSHRICIYCNQNALLGSYFCEKHQKQFIVEQNKTPIQTQNTINQITQNIERNLRETNYIRTQTQNRICEICGACSYNMRYCNSCYKSFIIGQNYDPLKEFENKKIYLCKSGIKVRSLSERIISDFLTENNIYHEYEREIKYKFTNYVYKETFIKSLHPDFYIPGPVIYKNRVIQNIYIEFWGFDNSNIKYTNAKKYKLKTYKEMGITIINTEQNDLINIDQSLSFKLLNYKENQINF